MRRERVADLRSPATGEALVLEVFQAEGEEVIDGRLIEPSTGTWYRIEGGIADLVPFEYRDADRYAAFSRTHNVALGPAPCIPATRDNNASSQIAFFAKYHDRYEREVVDSPYYRALNDVTFCHWVEQALGAGESVVEIGCGSGRQTMPMLERGLEVIALDVSEEMLSRARAKALAAGVAGRADFIRAMAERLPLRSGVGDAAVICSSLHHFSEPVAAIQEASRVTRRRSKFFLLEPHKSPLRFVFDWLMRIWTLWEEEANDEPLFNASQFRAWLGAAGYEVAISYSTYLPPHLFHALSARHGQALLAATDRLLGRIPGLRGLAGVIIATGKRTA